MKKLLIIPLILLFFIGSAFAATIYYPDEYANWPGYPQPPYPVNPGDQFGAYPTIVGAAVIFTDPNNYLESIIFDLTNMRWDTTLFINALWDGVEPYDQWDYFARVTSAGGVFYEVDPTFTPANYILVSGPTWRVGHPYSIESDKLSPLPGYLTSVAFTGTQLIYTFGPNQIQLFGPDTRFVVGLSQDCANDVFLTPIPEPGTLLLLGAGILGLGLVARRRWK